MSLRSSRSRDVVLVSGFALATQAFLLASQFVFAVIFGASVQSDAFFAALALPLYVSTVLISSLAVVFLPVVVELRAGGSGPEADGFISGIINLTAVVLTAVAIGGVLLADPLISLTAPGLPIAGRDLARVLATILWPSIVGSGLIVLLTALWQLDSRFGWSAAVPFLGAIANLALLALLAPLVGPSAAAIGWTASALVQAALLVPVLRTTWRPWLPLRHAAVRTFLVALAPLILANVFIRASTVVERYLASELPTGELSQVTYASRIVLTLAVLLSAGPMAVIFPRMARDTAAGGAALLRTTVSEGLESLWYVVAPIVALLIALAEPGVRLVFEHGAFTHADSEAVSSLVRLYSPSLVAGALGAITGRALYALRATRVLAAVGTVEGAAYVVYTVVLAHSLGASGIAIGFSIYYMGSLAWQLVYLRRALRASGVAFARRLATTTAVAILAGLGAWSASRFAEEPFIATLFGGLVGLGIYALGGIILLRRRTSSRAR
jgi:putative peptidoglycan lipid II flippase